MPKFSPDYKQRICTRFAELQTSDICTTPVEYAREIGVCPGVFRKWLRAEGIKIEKFMRRNGRL